MFKTLTKIVLIGLLFQAGMTNKASAQDIVKAKFKIVEIPTIYLKAQQQLELTVDTNIALDLKFGPNILGSLTINSNNVISFKPDKSDIQPVNVSLATSTDTFSFTIIPQFYFETSSSFLPYNVGSTLEPINFYRILIDSSDVKNKQLIIEGKEILFDNSNNLINEQLFKVSEIEYPYTKVSIYADKLIVKTNAWFPGVNLTVRANKLIFDGSQGAVMLNNTPYKYWTPESISPQKTIGDKGKDCDTMFVYYRTLELKNFSTNDTSPKLFSAIGGQGETAPFGSDGVPYPKVEIISKFDTIPVAVALSTCGSRGFVPATHAVTGIIDDPRNGGLVYIWFNKGVASTHEVRQGGGRDIEYITEGCGYQQRKQIDLYSKIFNDDTKKKALPHQGGMPGKGGKGGVIFSNNDIKNFALLEHGKDGELDTIRKSGAIDGPKEIWGYEVDNVKPEYNKGYIQWYYPQDTLLQPLTNNNQNEENGNVLVKNDSIDYYKSVKYARYAISQADELFRFGYIDSAAIIYNDYLKNFFINQNQSLTLEDSIEYEILEAKTRINQNKIYSNLDYYGNPNNWVPKLNIVLNYSLYKATLRNNFHLISQALYFLNEVKKNKKNTESLKSLLSNLSASNTDFQFRIQNLTTKEIPELQLQMGLVDSYIKLVDEKLKKVEAEINAQAEGIITERERKAKQIAFFKTLTGIAKIIPVYQPALGLAATSIEAFALKEGGEGAINKLSYFSENYNEMKKNQELIKVNLSNALEKSKSSSGEISFSSIKANREEISRNLSPVIKTMDGILKRTAYQPMPADALSIEIARLKEENGEYRGLIDSISHLVYLNKDITDKIIKISSEITNLSSALQNNISAVLAIKIELSSSRLISQNTILMIENIKADAVSNILYYQYLFAKSYEYFTLKQYRGYEKTAPLLNALPNMDKEPNPDNIYNAIEALYEAEVDLTIQSSIAGLNTDNTIPLQHKQTFEISKTDIENLNKQDTLKINLFRNFNYNVLSKKLISYDDILIKDIEIRPVYLDSEIDAFRNSGFAKSSIVVSHTGYSNRYDNEKKYSFSHLKEESNMPRVWRLDYDFKNVPSENYVEFDQTYLKLLCEFINSKNNDFCQNNIKSDVGYDSDLWIYKEDNQADGNNINLQKLFLTISFSAKSRKNSSSKSIVSFYSSNKETESIIYIKYKGERNNFINFNYLVLERNEQFEIYCDTKNNGKTFKYWLTNNGRVYQNNYLFSLVKPYYYFIPVYE